MRIVHSISFITFQSPGNRTLQRPLAPQRNPKRAGTLQLVSVRGDQLIIVKICFFNSNKDFSRLSAPNSRIAVLQGSTLSACSNSKGDLHKSRNKRCNLENYELIVDFRVGNSAAEWRALLSPRFKKMQTEIDCPSTVLFRFVNIFVVILESNSRKHMAFVGNVEN